MKNLVLVLVLAVAMVSCKPKDERPEKDWIVEVHYLDETTDTVKIRSQYEPEINIRNGVSILHAGWGSPMASYVKSIKILSDENR